MAYIPPRNPIVLTDIDEKIMDSLSKFKRLKIYQLKRTLDRPETAVDNRLRTLAARKYIEITEDGFVQIPANVQPKCTPNEHKVFDILIHFKDDIDGYYMGEFPFYLLFTMHDAVYDVAIFDDPILEVTQVTLINRSPAERIIAIIRDTDQMNRLAIEKNVMYITIDDDGKLEFLNAGEG